MKKRKNTYILTLIGLTCITVLGILSMLPQDKAILPSLITFDSEELGNSTDVYLYGNGQKDYVIDNSTLDKFIEVYVKGIKGKENVKNLTSLDKQEVRLILEDMGNYNTQRLKEVLSLEIEKNSDIEEAVSAVLDENLFDYDFERLDRILEMN